jgi:hypothetical protein
MEGLHGVPGKTNGLGKHAHSSRSLLGMLCEAVRGEGSQE